MAPGVRVRVRVRVGLRVRLRVRLRVGLRVGPPPPRACTAPDRPD